MVKKLTAEQLMLLQLAGAPIRDGYLAYNTDQHPLVMATSSSWALSGEYTYMDDPFGAPAFYRNIFLRNASQIPTGISAGFINDVSIIYPQTDPYIQALRANCAQAIAGNESSQRVCTMAMLKIITTLNGIEPLGDGGDFDYMMHMRTQSWHGSDHWAISVKTLDGKRRYIQKVAGKGVRFNCDRIWNEGLPEFSIGLEGLHEGHTFFIRWLE